MRKSLISIYSKVFVVLLSLLIASSVFAESGPMTHKPKGDNQPTKVDQMRDLMPDLIVSEISEDSAGNIIVKIKNIGKSGIKALEYERSSNQAFIELTIDGKSTKNMLATVDPQRALTHPNREINWNTGQKVWQDPADRKTEVIVRIDPSNQIQEKDKNNNESRKLFSRFIPVKSELIVKRIYRCGPNISFCMEFENKGNKEFKGNFAFDVDVIQFGVEVGSIVKGRNVMLRNSQGVIVAQISGSETQYNCRNVVIPANTTFSPTVLLCSFERIFAITPDIPEEGFDVLIRLLINEEGQSEKRPRFNFHITK
ncbi:CARDB domain-containing protein [Thermodesulfovibrio sp.]|uniref:CARDB domain-containing protein n=1 Tax=Thermodesulfovibrio sp. TaxID=2067987 RepID=UPI00309550E6